MMKKKWKIMLALTLAVTLLPMNVQAGTLRADAENMAVGNAVEADTDIAETGEISTETEVIPTETEITDHSAAGGEQGNTETVNTEMEDDGTPDTELTDDTQAPTETEKVDDDTEAATEIEKIDDDTEALNDADAAHDIDMQIDPSLINSATSERADSDGDSDVLGMTDGVAATGISPTQKLDPSSATVKQVEDLVRPVIYTNEVGSNWSTKYGSVTQNDNSHGISIGVLQWNATNALLLLKRIVGRDATTAQTVLGDELYNKILDDISWDGTKDTTRFIPSADQAGQIQIILKTKIGITAQDEMANEYLDEYMTLGFSTYGLRNAAALAYFCDLKNQCGTTTVKSIAEAAISLAGGTPANVTLNDLHEAALMNSVAGAYPSRRYMTYKSVADIAEAQSWSYYPSGSYRIPAAVVNSSTSKSEVSWLQSALNQTSSAGLTVDGVYGAKTETAVKAFQNTSGLTADGKAGQLTITVLIEAIYNGNLAGVTPTLKSTAITSKGVKVTWTKVTNATGYVVYRKTVGGGFSKLATIKSGATVTYTDTTAKNGTTYYYTVAAYNSISTSQYNTTGISKLYLASPTLKSAKLVSTGIKLTWTKNNSATGYYVYRKVSGGSYKKIATISKKSTVTYTDKTGKSGKKYTYKIYAYKSSTKSVASGTKSCTYLKTIKYKTTSKVNYRSGAGTKYAVKGTLKKGKTIYIVSSYSKKANGYTWKKVLISGKIYYLASKYIKKK